MIHITEDQVRAALPMSAALELVEQALRKLGERRAVNHPRRRIVLENRTVLHAMEAGDNDSGLLASKLYVTNASVGARFLVTLFDARTCELLATIDANALGQIRTGAASGVATRMLARPDASRLALIGSGFQAETQLEAIAAVRALTSVRVYSRSADKREAFARTMSERLGLTIEPADSAEAAVTDADIVTTITSARDPVVLGDWLRPGCHVNAAGGNHAKRREVDAEAVERAEVVAVDSLEQAKIEAGELIQAEQEGRFSWERAVELGDVLVGAVHGRTGTDQITFFGSQGLAIEDLAVAEHVYRQLAGR